MREIKLYGDLGKQFGKVFRLDVRNAAEAVRALCSQLAGFREYLESDKALGYIVKVADNSIAEEELDHPIGQSSDIKIIPVITGSNAIGRIIVGVALVAFAIYNPMGFLALGAKGAAVTTMAFGLGMSLAMGGIAELLAPSPPKMKGNTAPAATPSYMFDGPVNTMGPGYAVPVGYGRLLVGSHVVSAELVSVEEPI